MNFIPRTLLQNGVRQDLMQKAAVLVMGTCHYHRSRLKELTWHKHSEEDQAVGSVNDSSLSEKNGMSADIQIQLPWEIPRQNLAAVTKDCCHPCSTSRAASRSPTASDKPHRKSLSPPVPRSPSRSSAPTARAGDTSRPDDHPADSSGSESGGGGADGGGSHWEVAAGGRPPIAWDPDVAAECERSTLVTAPRPPPAVPERTSQADPASDAELRRLAGEGRLSAALRAASSLAADGTPPPFPTLALLADEAARRADPAAFERARRLAARLYPVNYARAARLRHAQLELLWRRRLFEPACGLLLRYRAEPVQRQLMARRFAVCCCLAAREGIEDALPAMQRAVSALMDGGLSEPLLSVWQHCMLSEQHSFQCAGRQLLSRHPAARRHLAPHLVHALQEAQLAGREDALRAILETVLQLGETRLYPLVFGALLDFQCLMEDVQSARETFKVVGEMSIALPSTVLNRYSSLLQRHRLKAPAALLRMKYRQRPPDDSAAAPQVPPAPSWFDKW